jgi:hypothetical protein
MNEKFGSFLNLNLLAIAQIGLKASGFFDRYLRNSSNPPCQSLILQQRPIGWDHFIPGKMIKEWGSRQYAYDLLEA